MAGDQLMAKNEMKSQVRNRYGYPPKKQGARKFKNW